MLSYRFLFNDNNYIKMEDDEYEKVYNDLSQIFNNVKFCNVSKNNICTYIYYLQQDKKGGIYGIKEIKKE